MTPYTLSELRDMVARVTEEGNETSGDASEAEIVMRGFLAEHGRYALKAVVGYCEVWGLEPTVVHLARLMGDA